MWLVIDLRSQIFDFPRFVKLTWSVNLSFPSVTVSRQTEASFTVRVGGQPDPSIAKLVFAGVSF